MTHPITEDGLESLVLDLVEWIAKKPRSYQHTMEAWRTSCPRLAVWEEAVDRGLVVRECSAYGVQVRATDKGFAFLAQRGRVMASVAE